MRKSLFTSLVLTGVVLAIFAGCGKKEAADATPAATPTEAPADATATAAPAPTPAAAPGAETLPGANAVRDSLAKKDYQNAVGGLLALRGIATGDRYTEYLSLYGEVIDALRAEAGSNRKAAEALAALQAVDRGR
jgi:hypothetical protein